MYSLDINFLKDRTPQKSGFSTGGSKTRMSAIGQTPLFIGAAVAAAIPAVVGAWWLLLQTQNTQLENRLAALDAELNRLGLQETEMKKIQAETSALQTDTKALATVFNQIRPWSAMLQDLRDRIPRSVQIESVKQIAAIASAGAPKPPAASGAATPPPSANPAGGIEITGKARSFSDVNDFLLTLKQSAFFQAADTRIISAELAEAAASNDKSSVKTSSLVKYTIQSNLSNVPAAELLQELERKGTLGLVTRIRTLQQKGVIQP
jgi:type IV pilus assembly protein PilN